MIAEWARRPQQQALAWMHNAHFEHIHHRRVRGLSVALTAKIPDVSMDVLDVGCGDGLLASEIAKQRHRLSFTGVDIIPRREAFIPVELFDGRTLPFADKAFDTVMFVDVLHHTTNQRELLREAARLARRAVLIKDHLSESRIDQWILRGMDFVGNRHNGVPLPYDYWTATRWRAELAAAGLAIAKFDDRIKVYPEPLNSLIGRGLHVIISARPTG